MDIFDIAIIGSGPAGMAAALYGARGKAKVACFEKGIAGGLIAQSSEIDNYPGGVLGESGADFSLRLLAQADSFGFEKIKGEVVSVSLKENPKIIKTKTGEYGAKTIIIATGTVPKLLDIPGELEFQGLGVSYCATCDGPLFMGLDIYVAGGGDSALEEAIFLARFAKSVTVVHRRDKFRAAKGIIHKASDIPNISFLMDKKIKEIKGKDFIRELVLEDAKTGAIESRYPSEGTDRLGVFIFVGLTPTSQLYEEQIKMRKGYILTNEDMATSEEGVFAAGDIRKKKLRQVVTATADGAIAATAALEYLMDEKCRAPESLSVS